MKKYFKLNKQEPLYLIVIFLSWLFLLFAKKGSILLIDALPLPLALFWMGTGIFLSVLFFKKVLKLEGSSLWKIKWKQLPLSFCALSAFELYFFSSNKSSFSYFFLCAPFLYWAASLIFYGERKNLVLFRTLALSLLIAILMINEAVISISASLLLASCGLIAFQRSDHLFSALLQGAAIQIILSGAFFFFHWQGEGSVQIKTIYAALLGGAAIGLSILLFLHAFSHLRKSSSFIGMSLCLITGLIFLQEIRRAELLCLPLFLTAALALRFAMKERKVQKLF